LAAEPASALVRWHRQHSDGLEQALDAYAFADNAPRRGVLEETGFVLIGPREREGSRVVCYLDPSTGVSGGASGRL
jgi:hypothetical protein